MDHNMKKNNRVLLLAPNGQVGFELCRSLSTFGELITLSRNEVDFTDLTTLETKINHMNPSLIVNAAAYTAVDKAETDQKNAFLLNARLPELLAKIAQDRDIWLVHYSSDYVYPGDGKTPWNETSVTAPLSIYGQSKLDGDMAIINHCKKYLIFRTSWVYAARRHNFMKTMLKLAQSRPDLKVVNDQVGAPTPARLIANVTAQALTKIYASTNLDVTELSGIYHLAPKGTVSWFDFATEIFAYARSKGIILQLQDSQFVGIPTVDYPTPATRPLNSRLTLEKIEKTFSLSMPNWKTQLHLTFDEYLDK